MIGRLRGVLAEVEADHCLIDCAGVGYVVACGARTLGRLPVPGDEATLHIESNWNAESGPRLYGFLTRDERRAFTTLTAIQGVGPKAALSVLDVLPPGELAAAVAREDKAAVARANGVGPKLALRIVTELKDKVSAFEGFEASPAVSSKPSGGSLAADAVSALVNLGYRQADAMGAVARAGRAQGGEATLEALIRGGLKELAG